MSAGSVMGMEVRQPECLHFSRKLSVSWLLLVMTQEEVDAWLDTAQEIEDIC